MARKPRNDDENVGRNVAAIIAVAVIVISGFVYFDFSRGDGVAKGWVASKK